MLPGAFQATKKDGIYYRSSITYRNKHISLGSFDTEEEAHEAYCVAERILNSGMVFDELLDWPSLRPLHFEKIVTLMNFRDNNFYIPTPIYMRSNYFSYFLSPNEELKFDVDDLFYYTTHKIMRRQGHLYVNDYGMQVTLLSRYGLKNYSVVHRDYEFANGDEMDYRYSNIIVINRFYGVTKIDQKGRISYRVKIHINGNYTIGTYSTELKAAIAYNKAIDLARDAGIDKAFQENYIDNLSGSEYADIYRKIKISERYIAYLASISNG